MKQLYVKLLLFAIALPVLSHAQTITRENFPNPGETYNGVFAGNYGTYGSWPAGTQTWDFNGWTSNQGDTVLFEYIDATNTAPFTGAEMSVGIAGLGDLYFSSNSDSLNLAGTKTTYNNQIIEAPYQDDQQTLVTFPFTYNDSFLDTARGSFSDTYSGTYNGFPVTVDATVYRTVHSQTTADGQGTVLLPGASYSNVLRLKINSTIIDSVYQQGTTTLLTVMTSTTEEYLFVDQDYKHQIIYAIKVQPEGEVAMELVFYFTDPVELNPLNTVKAKNANIQLYPNPASDIVTVKGLQSVAGAELILYTASGEEVARLKNNGESFAIPAELKTGLYFYTLNQSGTSLTKGKINLL